MLNVGIQVGSSYQFEVFSADLNVGQSNAVNVRHATEHKVQIVSITPKVIAGRAFEVVCEVSDRFGNRILELPKSSSFAVELHVEWEGYNDHSDKLLEGTTLVRTILGVARTTVD